MTALTDKSDIQKQSALGNWTSAYLIKFDKTVFYQSLLPNLTHNYFVSYGFIYL